MMDQLGTHDARTWALVQKVTLDMHGGCHCCIFGFIPESATFWGCLGICNYEHSFLSLGFFREGGKFAMSCHVQFHDVLSLLVEVQAKPAKPMNRNAMYGVFWIIESYVH